MSTGERDPMVTLVNHRIIKHTYGENGTGRYWDEHRNFLRRLLEEDIVKLCNELASPEKFKYLVCDSCRELLVDFSHNADTPKGDTNE